MKIVITDIVVDPEGKLCVAVAEKHAELAGKGRTPRRRKPDVAFDEELLAELAARRIPLRSTKTCIQVAVEVSARLNRRLSPAGARSRIAELIRASRGRLRWREK